MQEAFRENAGCVVAFYRLQSSAFMLEPMGLSQVSP